MYLAGYRRIWICNSDLSGTKYAQLHIGIVKLMVECLLYQYQYVSQVVQISCRSRMGVGIHLNTYIHTKSKRKWTQVLHPCHECNCSKAAKGRRRKSQWFILCYFLKLENSTNYSFWKQFEVNNLQKYGVPIQMSKQFTNVKKNQTNELIHKSEQTRKMKNLGKWRI